jgi:hypothetical protein
MDALGVEDGLFDGLEARVVIGASVDEYNTVRRHRGLGGQTYVGHHDLGQSRPTNTPRAGRDGAPSSARQKSLRVKVSRQTLDDLP